ncbi:uncharacterized protein A4U43_UnF11080 [Asparagus officinalis]|uniref:Uncharacterized protein n=1 Tax=Asparagus officinalis TaxID=4686 RepID=A0A1R3L5C2_ASPOF|nr:uncharacterized protein A4U43_UnF11080 [Asparagus officinalis]
MGGRTAAAAAGEGRLAGVEPLVHPPQPPSPSAPLDSPSAANLTRMEHGLVRRGDSARLRRGARQGRRIGRLIGLSPVVLKEIGALRRMDGGRPIVCVQICGTVG